MQPRVEDSDTIYDTPKPKQDQQMTEDFPYREVVSSLMYIMTCTQQDIAYITGNLRDISSNCVKHTLKQQSTSSS
jgi:hypothetical protein